MDGEGGDGNKRKTRGGGGEGTRQSTRVRKVTASMARVDQDTRQQVLTARLDALENDNAAAEQDDDSDEYVLEDDIEGAGPGTFKKKKGARRATRQQLAAGRGPKSLQFLLDEAHLQAAPPNTPTYLTAEMGPPATTSARKFCSVCGFTAKYTCTRCGTRYCSRKCNATHVDTRCLKFIA